MINQLALLITPGESFRVILQTSPQSQEGYMWMFIIMASTPYLLLVIIGGGIFRARRRQREDELARAVKEQQDWEATRSTEGSKSER
jgi:hypothetical protein